MRTLTNPVRRLGFICVYVNTISWSSPMTPMANLPVGLLDRAGVHAERVGDSTGRIDLEPLSLSGG